MASYACGDNHVSRPNIMNSAEITENLKVLPNTGVFGYDLRTIKKRSGMNRQRLHPMFLCQSKNSVRGFSGFNADDLYPA
jgi:hypothetical protein